MDILMQAQSEAERITERDAGLISRDYAALKPRVAALFEQVGVDALN